MNRLAYISDGAEGESMQYRFQRYSELLREIENQKQRLAVLRSKAGEPGTQVITGMPHNPAVRDALGGTVAEIDELEGEIRQTEFAAQKERSELERYIAALRSPDERAVLRMRYFDRMKWEDMSDRLHFSIAWVYALHKRALHNKIQIHNKDRAILE